jgi:hypothetical protein
MTSNRLQGSGVLSLNAFKKLVGEENYHGVIVATTRWDEIAAEQIRTATKREKELRLKVGDIVEGDGSLVSLSAGRIDAMKIIGHFATRGPDNRLTLAFQRQLVDEGLAIHETDAGRLLFEELSTELEEASEDSHTALVEQLRSFEIEHIGTAAER